MTDEEIRKLVIRLAKENIWGYGRIHGELKKHGVKICDTTVKNILITAGIDPCPERSEKPWANFIATRPNTLGYRFLQQKGLDAQGLCRNLCALLYPCGIESCLYNGNEQLSRQYLDEAAG